MSGSELDETDAQAVLDVLRSGRLALGPKAEEFERQMADYVGIKHAVVVSSGTAALHVIVKALGLGTGDEVLVPSFTFTASVNAFLYEGCRPVFVDIDPETKNLESRPTRGEDYLSHESHLGGRCLWASRRVGRHNKHC